MTDEEELLRRKEAIRQQALKNNERLDLYAMQLGAWARVCNYMTGQIWGDGGKPLLFEVRAVPRAGFRHEFDFGIRGVGESILRLDSNTQDPRYGITSIAIAQMRTPKFLKFLAKYMRCSTFTIERFTDLLQTSDANSLYQLELLAGAGGNVP